MFLVKWFKALFFGPQIKSYIENPQLKDYPRIRESGINETDEDEDEDEDEDDDYEEQEEDIEEDYEESDEDEEEEDNYAEQEEWLDEIKVDDSVVDQAEETENKMSNNEENVHILYYTVDDGEITAIGPFANSQQAKIWLNGFNAGRDDNYTVIGIVSSFIDYGNVTIEKPDLECV